MSESKPLSAIELIRQAIKGNDEDDLDNEWSLFTRFGQSMYQFCTKMWKEKDLNNMKEEIKTKVSSQSDSHANVVKCVLNNSEMSKTVEMLVKDMNSSNIDKIKSCEKAKTFREEGNEYFKKKSYDQAIEKYSNAISYATHSTEELTINFANRSAAFYHLRFFNDCLNDIHVVLSNGNYSSGKLYLIYARKIMCLKALNRDQEARDVAGVAEKELNGKVEDEKMREMMIEFVKKSLVKDCEIGRHEKDIESEPSTRKVETNIRDGGWNESIPGASNKIEMRNNDSKGRFVVACQVIPASTILFKEEPFVYWLRPSNYEHHCYHCFKYIFKRFFIPCPGCIFARFCSEKCLATSRDKFHKQECKKMDLLSIMSIGHMALRAIYRIEKDRKIGTQRNQMVTSLIDHITNFPPEMLISLSLSSLFLGNSISPSKDGKLGTDLATLILKYTLKIHCNSVGIQHNNDNMHSLTDSNIKIIGMGLYPSIALMNHSCDKKTYTIFDGSSSLCIKSSDDLKSGDEVTLCYGPFYQKMSTTDRQSYTKKNYFFTCDCSCCKEKKEPIGLAFACPAPCFGPVIYSYSDPSSTCLKCSRLISGDASQFFFSKLAEVKGQLYEDWNNLMPVGRWIDLEKKILYLLNSYSPFLYSSSEIIRELKEKLAVIFENLKMIEPAAKLWLECYKITKKLEDGDDNYECLFYLLKITSALIEEADGHLSDQLLVKSHVEKAVKYYKRSKTISKKLQGKERKLLETSSDILHNIPDFVAIENDLKNLMSYCSLIKTCDK